MEKMIFSNARYVFYVEESVMPPIIKIINIQDENQNIIFEIDKLAWFECSEFFGAFEISNEVERNNVYKITMNVFSTCKSEFEKIKLDYLNLEESSVLKALLFTELRKLKKD